MKQRATAIAIATLMVAAGLSVAPPAAASSNCENPDFQIADSESAASTRDLAGGASEIGVEDVVSGTDETLHVALRSSPAEMKVRIFETDANDNCTEVTKSLCGTSPVVLNSFDQEETCTLDATDSQDYFVEYDNVKSTSLLYETWSVT